VPGGGKSRRTRRREGEEQMAPDAVQRTIVELEEEMLLAADELRFEYAAKLRDEIKTLRREFDIAVAEANRGTVPVPPAA
jgi:excinuclease ABC subunit B